KLAPDKPAAYASRGICLIGKNEERRAIDDLDQAIKYDLRNALGYALVAWSAKARVHVANGEDDRTIAAFDEAIKLDPTSAALLIDRDSAWRQKGDTGQPLAYYQAFSDYDAAIRINRDDAEFAALGWRMKAVVYRRTGSLENAISSLDQAIRLRPENASYLI